MQVLPGKLREDDRSHPAQHTALNDVVWGVHVKSRRLETSLRGEERRERRRGEKRREEKRGEERREKRRGEERRREEKRGEERKVRIIKQI